MLAGGIGFGKKEQAQKGMPKKGDKIIILGGDNYRIGMGVLQYPLQILVHLAVRLNSMQCNDQIQKCKNV